MEVNLQLFQHAAHHAVERDGDRRAANSRENQKRQTGGIVPRDDVDEVLARHAAEQADRGTEHAERDIQRDHFLAAAAVREQPFPVR